MFLTRLNGKCEICNYDLIIEKHHPDGKKEISKGDFIAPDGRKYTLTKKEHVNKDNIIIES